MQKVLESSASKQMLIEDNFNDIIKSNIQNIKKASSNLHNLKSKKQENLVKIISKLVANKPNLKNLSKSDKKTRFVRKRQLQIDTESIQNENSGIFENLNLLKQVSTVSNCKNMNQEKQDSNPIKVYINVGQELNASDSLILENQNDIDMPPALVDQDLAPIQEASFSDRQMFVQNRDNSQISQVQDSMFLNSTKSQSKLVDNNYQIYRSLNKEDSKKRVSRMFDNYDLKYTQNSPDRFQEFSNLKQSTSSGTSNYLPMIKQPNYSIQQQLQPSIRSLVAGKSEEINQKKELLRKRHKQNKEFFKKIQSTKGFTKFIPINQINAKIHLPFQEQLMKKKKDAANTTMTSINDQYSNYSRKEQTNVIGKNLNIVSDLALDTYSRNFLLPTINYNSVDKLQSSKHPTSQNNQSKQLQNKSSNTRYKPGPHNMVSSSQKRKVNKIDTNDYFAQDLVDESDQLDQSMGQISMQQESLRKLIGNQKERSTPKISIQTKQFGKRILDASKLTNKRVESSLLLKNDSQISYLKDTEGFQNLIGFNNSSPSDNFDLKKRNDYSQRNGHALRNEESFQQYVKKESLKSSLYTSQQLTPTQKLAESLSQERYQKMKRVKQQIFGNDTRYGWRNSPHSSQRSNAYNWQEEKQNGGQNKKKTILQKVQSPSIKVKGSGSNGYAKFGQNNDIQEQLKWQETPKLHELQII